MNRFLVAKQLKSGDELSWNAKIGGEHCKCLWRNAGRGRITFLATIENTTSVKIVFTLQPYDLDNMPGKC